MSLRVNEPQRPLHVLARLALLVAFGDWLTKAVAARMVLTEPVILADGLRFAVVHNAGTAFGLSAGAYTWQLNFALTLAAILLMIPVAKDLARIDPAAPRALGLIVGGALGNLVSLVVSPPGVVDFISLRLGSHSEIIFNLADVAAYVGLAMMIRTGFLIVAEMRRQSRPSRSSVVSHWVTERRRALVDREVVRPVAIADMVMSVNEADIPRPESVRRTELVDLEAEITDPKVIDIRPRLAQNRSDALSQRSEARGD